MERKLITNLVGVLLVLTIVVAGGKSTMVTAQSDGALTADNASGLTETATYIKVTKSCGPNYGGGCLNVRRSPTTNSPIAASLRDDIVLKVSDTVQTENRTWFNVEFDEWLRYPNRVSGDWWVAGDFVQPIQASQYQLGQADQTRTGKKIIVDVSDQLLYAYNKDGSIFMKKVVSTGKQLYPTPRGHFQVFKMTPTRYMQGPIPGITDQKYDLPGVPWNLYFTQQGAVIHGAYWHNNFGQRWSNGCVNLPPAQAEKLYNWAEVGTSVIVRN